MGEELGWFGLRLGGEVELGRGLGLGGEVRGDGCKIVRGGVMVRVSGGIRNRGWSGKGG